MIEISTCPFTGSCSSCQSTENVIDFNLGKEDPLTGKISTGIKISLCKECRKQMADMLKKGDE